MCMACAWPTLPHAPSAVQADTDLLGEREQMQRAFAEWLAMRADWAAQQAAAKAKILADRYPDVKDEFQVEEVRPVLHHGSRLRVGLSFGQEQRHI